MSYMSQKTVHRTRIIHTLYAGEFWKIHWVLGGFELFGLYGLKTSFEDLDVRLPSSAISLRPLGSLDQHDLFVQRASTSMGHTIVGPTLWNQLPPLTRSILLTG